MKYRWWRVFSWFIVQDMFHEVCCCERKTCCIAADCAILPVWRSCRLENNLVIFERSTGSQRKTRISLFLSLLVKILMASPLLCESPSSFWCRSWCTTNLQSSQEVPGGGGRRSWGYFPNLFPTAQGWVQSHRGSRKPKHYNVIPISYCNQISAGLHARGWCGVNSAWIRQRFVCTCGALAHHQNLHQKMGRKQKPCAVVCCNQFP